MAQVAVNEAVSQLLGELIEAWNAGDAHAYGARFSPDVTFTNSDGSVDFGRAEVVQRAAEAFAGVLAGTKLSISVRKLRLIRTDVAVADLDLLISGLQLELGPDGVMRTSLLLVLVQDDDHWSITAHHNVPQSASTAKSA